MEQKIIDEISSLHSFFESYFRGNVAENEISRFESVISTQFELITPSAQQIDRPAIIEMIRGSHGKRKDMKLWTANERVKKLGDNLYLATYNEYQEIGDGNTSNRLSTAVFKIDDRPIWMHVHETWVVSK